ncbi:hypothetical protein [Streptomyces mirabilis]|uniref:hypothetical protein n=1 Tax=Streptomyces mirabilis TaxID=68239 RepID=UPI003823F270
MNCPRLDTSDGSFAAIGTDSTGRLDEQLTEREALGESFFGRRSLTGWDIEIWHGELADRALPMGPGAPPAPGGPYADWLLVFDNTET